MLTQAQIRKLARALSDRQVCNDPNADEVLLAPGLWTNKILALFEPPPAVVRDWPTALDADDEQLAAIERLCRQASRPLYPTFIGQVLDADRTLVRFDAPGLSLWADARYLSTAIKKAGRRGRLEYALSRNGDTQVILITNGGPRLALLAQVADESAPADLDRWSWTLENRDLPPPRQARDRQPREPLPRPTGPASLPQLALL